MSKLKVAIVGLGASGAFAARAAYDLACDVDVFGTSKQVTMSPGATWLHWVPEDVTEKHQPVSINILSRGLARTYSKKQWGKVYPSSFPEQPVVEQGYDPMKVIPDLMPAAIQTNLLPFALSDTDVLDLSRSYDCVFQTFPSADSIATQPALRPFVAAAKFGVNLPQNYVVYQGEPDTLIVREALLFGNHFLEFPKDVPMERVNAEMKLDGYKLVELRDIDPITEPWKEVPLGKVHYVGRWATWDRKMLAHDAYETTKKVLLEKM